MHRWLGLLIVGASLGCAPEATDLSPLVGADDYGFLLIERPFGLELWPLDGRPVARTRDETNEVWYVLTLPRSAVAEAHPLFDPSRADDVELTTPPPEELGQCLERGVLDNEALGGPTLDFSPASLTGARLHRFSDSQWSPIESGEAMLLSKLAVKVPILDSCGTRRWRSEPFFREPRIFEFGQSIRDFTFSETYPTALEVRGLFTLGDGAYLIHSLAVLVVGRVDETPDFSGALLLSELAPPPSDWAPSGSPGLRWEFTKFDAAGTSTSGEQRFLVRLRAIERGGENDADEWGTSLVALYRRDARLRWGEVLSLTSNSASDRLVDFSTLGPDGGFVIATPESLLVRETFDAPTRASPKLWAPASVTRVDLPDAEIVVAVKSEGFWLGDPRRGFDGLRFEAADVGLSGCSRVGISHAGGPTELVAGRGRQLIFGRRNRTWTPLRPWIANRIECIGEGTSCGRPTLPEARTVRMMLEGPEGAWMVRKEFCPVSFSFPLEEDRCARTEIFDLGGVGLGPGEDTVDDLLGFSTLPEGRVVFGRLGLVAKVRPEI